MNVRSEGPSLANNLIQLALLFTLSFSLKMLLAPAYFSTDMDVHQNWLRITAQKPLTEWYFDVNCAYSEPKQVDSGLPTSLCLLLMDSKFDFACDIASHIKRITIMN